MCNNQQDLDIFAKIPNKCEILEAFISFIKEHKNKSINYFSKIMQIVLMNYFLEDYISRLLKEDLC